MKKNKYVGGVSLMASSTFNGLRSSLKSSKPKRDYGSNIMGMNPYKARSQRVRVKVKRRPRYKYKTIKTYNDYDSWI